LTPICTESFVGWGFPPANPLGELTALPQTPELYLWGLLLKGEREFVLCPRKKKREVSACAVSSIYSATVPQKYVNLV